MQPLNSKTTRTLLEALLSLTLFGCIPVVIKYVSANVYTIGLFRLFVSALVMYLGLRFFGRLQKINRTDALQLFCIGVLFGLHWLTYFFSIKLASASIGAIGLSTYGIFLVILGWLIYGRRLSAINFLALAMVIIGSLLVVPEFNFNNDATIGLLLGILSGLLYATLPLLHQKNKHLSSSVRAFGQFFFALIVFLFCWPLSDWQLPVNDWLGLIVLAVLTLVCHTLWVHVSTVFSTTTTSMVYYVYVPVAMFMSYWILDEAIDSVMILGATLVVAGNLLGIRSQFKQNKVFMD